MIEVAIVNRLLANMAVAAIVGTRGYQMKLPQDGDFPTLRVQLISDVESVVLTGDVTNLLLSRIQTDVWASDETSDDPYQDARDAGQAVNTALAGQPFTADGVAVSSIRLIDRSVEYVAEELRLVRVRQDYAVMYQFTD